MAPLTPGVGVLGPNLANNLPSIKIYSYAKFLQDWSDSLDFYRVPIYIFVLYILDIFIYIHTHTDPAYTHMRMNAYIYIYTYRYIY